MKSNIQLLFTLLMLLMGSMAYAQAPQKFNYQGIARDAKGNPVAKQQLAIKLSVLPTIDATVSEYEETQLVTTNEFGLYTLQIGAGTAISGEMKNVKWETGNKYIRVAIDPKGGTDYVDAGTTQLLSVPYAIYADKAGVARETANGTDKTRAGTVSTAAGTTGDVNKLAKFTSAGNTITNSQITDNGNTVIIGSPASSSANNRMHIYTNNAVQQTYVRMENANAGGTGRFYMGNDGANSYATFTKYGTGVAGNYGGNPLYPNANLLAFGNNGSVANDGNGRFLMTNGGNIGLALTKTTGTTLKFHADFTSGFVGIGGNAAPATHVHINSNTPGDTMKITNSGSGHTATDGLEIRTAGTSASITNMENDALYFGTNNTDRMNINASGNVSIGSFNFGSSALNLNTATPSITFDNGADGFVVEENAAGQLAFAPNVFGPGNTPAMIIDDNTGNVGVATSNPSVPLEVQNTTLNSSSTTDGIVNIGNATGFHVTLDDNEIQSKNGVSGFNTLFLNYFGGDVMTGFGTNMFNYDGSSYLGNNTMNVNASALGRVGVGTSSPLTKLHVETSNDTAFLAVTNSGSSQQIAVLGRQPNFGFGAGVAGIAFGGTAVPTTTDIGVYGSSSGYGVWSQGPIKIVDGNQGNGKVLVSNSTGTGSWQGAVGFLANSCSAGTIASGVVTLIYGTEDFDESGSYNNTTGEFTAPIDGLYQFNFGAVMTAGGGTSQCRIGLMKNGSFLPGTILRAQPSTTAQWSIQNSVTVKLVAGDVIKVELGNFSGGSITVSNNSLEMSFSGHLVR
ncbi:MAG: hypothetical protein JNJ58_05855 [Chitinophagaceae bacterium]|nr:hypothetical protein [Chitinophagaceae bacterium]